MPVPPRLPPGSPVWADLLSSDPDRAVAFYGRVFGWTAVQLGPKVGGYINFIKHHEVVAGLLANSGHSPDLWTVYLSSDDVDDTAATVLANEGRVYVHDSAGDLGRMVVFSDPDGALVGAWQAGTHRGYGLTGESGTPVWHELHTTNYEGALKFYRGVFDWQPQVLSDSPDFRMSTIGTAALVVAGVFDASDYIRDGEESRWMIYFGVTDVDETSTLITMLGGTMLDDPADSPFGRLAHAADPTGALFTIVEVGPN
jgi:predicted enzyme related to lactoylglutathione lyase